MDCMTRTASAVIAALIFTAGCSATPPIPTPTRTASVSPVDDVEDPQPTPQPRPSMTCEDVPAKVQAAASRVLVVMDGGSVVGHGAMVSGGISPEGRQWKVIAFKRAGITEPVQAILWTLPAEKGGRDEFSQISSKWTGNLAEFRGFLKWGVEARAAAVACLN